MNEYDASRIVRCAPAVVGANVNESRSVSISSGRVAAVRSSWPWPTAFSTVATAAIAAIRAGTAERLAGQFPVEIDPLARETNALIDANKEIVERARTAEVRNPAVIVVGDVVSIANTPCVEPTP